MELLYLLFKVREQREGPELDLILIQPSLFCLTNL